MEGLGRIGGSAVDLGLATPARGGQHQGQGQRGGGDGTDLAATRAQGTSAWATPGRRAARERSARRLALGVREHDGEDDYHDDDYGERAGGEGGYGDRGPPPGSRGGGGFGATGTGRGQEPVPSWLRDSVDDPSSQREEEGPAGGGSSSIAGPLDARRTAPLQPSPSVGARSRASSRAGMDVPPASPSMVPASLPPHSLGEGQASSDPADRPLHPMADPSATYALPPGADSEPFGSQGTVRGHRGLQRRVSKPPPVSTGRSPSPSPSRSSGAGAGASASASSASPHRHAPRGSPGAGSRSRSRGRGSGAGRVPNGGGGVSPAGSSRSFGGASSVASGGVPSGAPDTQQLYVPKDQLQPLKNPQSAWQHAADALVEAQAKGKTASWSKQVQALLALRRMAAHHPVQAREHANRALRLVAPLVSSPRSALAKSALLAVADLLGAAGEAAEPALPACMPPLLKRAGDASNAFLQAEAGRALSAVVRGASAKAALGAVLGAARSAEPLVRLSSAPWVEKVAQAHLPALSGAQVEAVTRQAAKFTQAGNEGVRHAGKRTLAVLRAGGHASEGELKALLGERAALRLNDFLRHGPLEGGAGEGGAGGDTPASIVGSRRGTFTRHTGLASSRSRRRSARSSSRSRAPGSTEHGGGGSGAFQFGPGSTRHMLGAGGEGSDEVGTPEVSLPPPTPAGDRSTPTAGDGGSGADASPLDGPAGASHGGAAMAKDRRASRALALRKRATEGAAASHGGAGAGPRARRGMSRSKSRSGRGRGGSGGGKPSGPMPEELETILTKAGDSDWRTRQGAVQSLAQFTRREPAAARAHSMRVLDVVSQHVGDGQSKVAAAAAVSLADVIESNALKGKPLDGALPIVVAAAAKGIASTQPAVAQASGRALRLLEDRASARALLAPLVGGVAHSSARVKAAALASLARAIPRLDPKHAAQVVDRQVLPALARAASSARVPASLRAPLAGALQEVGKAMGTAAAEKRVAALLPATEAGRVSKMLEG